MSYTTGGMSDDLLEQAADLRGRGEAFVLATVVACKRPTSAKPGAKAIIRADGGFVGWVGGSCTQPLVTQEALKALRDGQPRLLLLTLYFCCIGCKETFDRSPSDYVAQ